MRIRSIDLVAGALLGAASLVAGDAHAISRDEVLARAKPWLNVVPYCQAPNGGYDSDCKVTCVRPPNPAIDAWRSDCSGYVSYAWGLPAPGKLVSGLVAVSHDISASELAPGDALASDGHIALFIGWVNGQSHVRIWHEGNCGQTALEKDWAVSSVSGGTIESWTTFHAIRFNDITDVAPWQGTFESQSWPPGQGAPIQMTVGQSLTGSLKVKNTGSQSWPAGVVKLAPTPRDQASPFASSTWLTSARVSSVAADVKPGETGTFEWDLTASKTGDFKPTFTLVAEGLTWFGDSGGPADDAYWVNVHVEKAPAGGSGASGAGGAMAGAAGKGGAAGGGGAGGGGKNAAGLGGKTGPGQGGSSTTGGTAGAGALLVGSGGIGADDAAAGESESSGGCSLTSRGGQPAAAVIVLALALARRRRRID